MNITFDLNDIENICLENVERQGIVYVPSIDNDSIYSIEDFVNDFCEEYGCNYTYNFDRHCFEIRKIETK